MTPTEFMMYATPALVLAGHIVTQIIERARSAQATRDMQAAAALTTMSVNQQTRISSNQNAQQSAALVAEQLAPAQAVAGEKLDTIHGLVNGTLTAANAKIAALQAELARLKEDQSKPPA